MLVAGSTPAYPFVKTIKMKKCCKCGKLYPATTQYFHKNGHCNYGLDTRCKRCRKQYSQQHQEERTCYMKQYQQQHQTEIKRNREKHYATIRGYIGRLRRNIYARCNNPKSTGYKNYGGRGIKVKFISFDDFYNYVVNEIKVDPRGLTIDRINNDGDYEPGNIRFVTRPQNNRNKRLRYSE